MTHFIKYCKKCKAIIAQCRCPDLNKTKEFGICVSCSEEGQEVPISEYDKRIDDLTTKNEARREAHRVASIYLSDSQYTDPFDLAMLIAERVEYYSDRWGDTASRFEVIRILLNECEKRWNKRHDTIL